MAGTQWPPGRPWGLCVDALAWDSLTLSHVSLASSKKPLILPASLLSLLSSVSPRAVFVFSLCLVDNGL